jgi:hypothetical protein
MKSPKRNDGMPHRRNGTDKSIKMMPTIPPTFCLTYKLKRNPFGNALGGVAGGGPGSAPGGIGNTPPQLAQFGDCGRDS